MSRKRSEREWGELLQRWENSGEAQASFCKKQAIPLSTFQYNLKKKREKESSYGFVEAPLAIKEESSEVDVTIRTDYCTISMGKSLDEKIFAVILRTLREISEC